MNIQLKPLFFLPMFLFFFASPQAQDDVRARAKQFEQKIVESARQHKLDPKLMWTIGYLESRFRPAAKSSKGAWGLMQILPSTAADFGIREISQLLDAHKNIETAARFISTLVHKYGSENIDLLLAAYNAGSGAVDAFNEGRTVKIDGKTINPRGLKLRIPPYEETQRYVQEGLRVYKQISATGFLPDGPVVKRPAQRELVSNTKSYSKPPIPIVNTTVPMPQPAIAIVEMESIYFDDAPQPKSIPTTTLEKKELPQPVATGVRALFFQR